MQRFSDTNYFQAYHNKDKVSAIQAGNRESPVLWKRIFPTTDASRQY